MDNDSIFGNSGPAKSRNQAHLEPIQEDKKISDNKEEDEEEVLEEDFDKFNLDKVDELEKNDDKKED